PSALQVVRTVPLHAGWLGVHSCALQASDVASQYCPEAQVCDSIDESPFALHCRSSCPWQNFVPFGHTTAAHAPATQTWLDVAQSIFVVDMSPSAEQVSTFSDPACVSQ